jgi:hypothetical protein
MFFFFSVQELLRTKLDSLKLRLQMNASQNQLFQEYQTEMRANSSVSLQPSLEDIKSDFENRRKRQQQQILQVLKQKYPELDGNELSALLKSTEV